MKLNELTITEAREGLKNKKFSSSELTRACLEQIEKHDAKINAFITVCKKQAIEQAKEADKLLSNGAMEQWSNLPLLGIPIALKDLYSTKDIKTTAGSKVLKDYSPVYDATVVKKLKDAGAVIIGKTNLDAWAHGSSGENSDFGPTKNPWNQEYVPGGSSSGSAAALAADMYLAATGTDTGGSIRLPASFCNLVGLKPTYGRVSRYGIIAMASSLDSIGHLAKTVEDSALLLNITAGNDVFDATTPKKPVPDYQKGLQKGIKELKIGIPKEYLQTGLDEKVKENFEDTKRILSRLGANLIEVSLPHTEYAIACYYIIQPAEVSSNLERYDGIRFGNDRSFFTDEAKRRIMLGTFTLSAGYYEAYYKKAMQVRTLIKKDFEDAFVKVDALIAPVSPTPSWKLGEKVDDPLKMYLSDVFTVTANLAGIPALAVPSGFINGLPVGIQILGPQFSEELLFQVGFAYEQATEWYKRKAILNL
ncbi:MAG: Asp-tRNA(Asn)/Glu-tRNA(Gln) amidotransferase subunit GatA [Candidatus Levybacteria bacterium]|nr:Asp-tRNA(Asn)/Glu-tRNA(Gln) amidotransferase subunit GatA [Candidatus Levybacteria bacterium]MBI2189958.1 Asp-tRNA(Asn)/Glu-tRNA(Gln) amidotransferase subunit GatA [Candidatus Levybacteria bacterium]MBI3069882.1 Asp-tRNA(Asn)/Glu-tRNA(Gln) amidotransferase subunit GatA [Candidatus Levybacteria bacterium]